MPLYRCWGVGGKRRRETWKKWGKLNGEDKGVLLFDRRRRRGLRYGS